MKQKILQKNGDNAIDFGNSITQWTVTQKPNIIAHASTYFTLPNEV